MLQIKSFFLNAYNFGTVSPTEVPCTSRWPQEQDLSLPKIARPIYLWKAGYRHLYQAVASHYIYQTFQNQTATSVGPRQHCRLSICRFLDFSKYWDGFGNPSGAGVKSLKGPHPPNWANQLRDLNAVFQWEWNPILLRSKSLSPLPPNWASGRAALWLWSRF